MNMFFTKKSIATLFIALSCALFSNAQNKIPKSKQAQDILSRTNLDLLTREDFATFDPIEYAKINFPKAIMASNDAKAKKLAWTKYINEHPYQKVLSLGKADVKSLPKYDRPDLANMHDYMRHIDPSLGYVPNERLVEATELTFQMQAAKAAINNLDWIERGPNNVGGRTRALMWDPNDVTVKKAWAGGVGGGLWYNDDVTQSTSSWNKVNDFWENIAVTSIAYDPSNTQIFYVGTGEGFFNADAQRGNGIWKTTDGGVTWARLASTTTSVFNYVNDVVVTSTGVVFAATSSGLRRSADGGATWTTPTSTSGTYYDLEITATGTIIAAKNNGTIQLSTTTAGTVFNAAINPGGTGGNRVEVACAPSDANVIYAISSDGGNIQWFRKSTDGGSNWTSITVPKYIEQNCSVGTQDFTRDQSWYDLILAVSPADANIVLAGGVDIHRSINGGTSWTGISYWTGACKSYVHADQHAMAFRPGNSNHCIFGNDGGISYSADAGNSGVSAPVFSARNKDYNVTQYYSVALKNTASDNYMLGGAQDNGSHKFTTAGVNSITEVTGGDGAFCHIDQDNANFQLTSYVFNSYYRSTNGGTSFGSLTDGTGGRFINPTDYDNTANILYCAESTGTLYRISNISGTPTYSSGVSVGALGTTPSAITVSPYTANRIFVAGDNGNIRRVDNANGTPTSTDIDVSATLPTGYINGITLGDSDNHIIVVYSNYGGNKVYETTNGGTTWVNKTGNLPDMPIYSALIKPSDPTKVILATELGVWSTTDISAGSVDWTASNTGLANVRCDMLQMRASDKLVAVATHGRGMYTSDVFADLSAGFTANTTTTCQNQTITFTNTSSGTITDYSWNFGTGASPATATTVGPHVVTYTTTGSKTVSLSLNSGASVDTKTNYITVNSNTALSAPTLNTPANGATGQSSATAFSWTSIVSATSYTVDIATDAGFTSIVQTQSNIVTNSYTASPNLNANTTYFWRVRALNSCSIGNYSSAFSFTTENNTCTIFASADVPKTISATGTPTILSTLSISVPVGAIITDVNLVNLIGTHSYVSDLTARIVSPALTSITLFGGLCGNAANFNINFDSEAVLSYSSIPCPPIGGGTYQPQSTLTTFNGQNPNGIWTLRINDAFDQDGGSLTSWGLNICYTLPTASADFTANATTVCQGQTVTYTNASSGATTYAWDFGTGASPATASTVGPHVVTYSSAGTKTVSLNVNSGADIETKTNYVTVNSLSTAPTGITGTTTICAGGITTLTLTGGFAGTGAVARWYSASCGGTLVGTGSSVVVSPASTTSYFVRYEGTCNTTTCASTSVTVNSLSTAPTGITGTTTICAGGTTTLTLTGGSAGTGAVARWYSASCGGTLVGTDNSVVVSPASTTSYFVRYEGTCNTTTCASTSVTVNSLSTAPTGITGTTTICAGGTTTLTLTGGSAGTGAVARWYSASCGGTLVGTGSSVVVSPASTTSYFVRYEGTCNTTTCASTSVTVNTTVSPSVAISASATTICSGVTATFTATPTNGGSTPSYQWKVNGSDAGFNSAVFASTFANNDLVSCVMTSNSACASPLTATSNVVTMTVNSSAVAIIQQPSNTGACFNSSATFVINASGVNSYQWQVSNGGPFVNVNDGSVYSGTTTSTLTINTLAGLNNYQFKCILTDNCGSLASNSATLIVDPGTTFYQDFDNDGFGNPSVSIIACTSPLSYVVNNTDCDDSDDLIGGGPCGPVGPTTQLSTSCGATGLLRSSYIYATALTGAGKYKFTFTNASGFNQSYTTGNYSPKMLLNYIPGLQYGQTYNVIVQTYLGTVLTNPGPVCSITLAAFPATQLSALSCGTTGLLATDYINCNGIPGAMKYQFNFTNDAGFNQTYTTTNDAPKMQLSNIATTYGSTYSVIVKAIVGSVWSSYGPACKISMANFPTSQLTTLSCNQTVTKSSIIYANRVAGGYRYKFNVTDNGTFTQSFTTGNDFPQMNLTNMPGLVIGNTYQVTVQAYVNGVWGTVGDICSIFVGGMARAANTESVALVVENNNEVIVQEVVEVISEQFKISPIDEEPSPISNASSTLEVMVYPNPISKNASLSISFPTEEIGKVILTDITGRIVAEQNFNTNLQSTVEVNLAERKLDNGIYNLSIIGNKSTSQKTIVVVE